MGGLDSSERGDSSRKILRRRVPGIKVGANESPNECRGTEQMRRGQA